MGYLRRPQRLITAIASVFAVGVALSACSPTEPRNLEGSWDVRELVSQSFTGAPSGELTMVLADGEGHGFSGCNTYTFRYLTQGDAIQVGDIVVTRLACKQPGVMETERAFLESIAESNLWSISRNTLTFSGDSSSIVFLSSDD